MTTRKLRIILDTNWYVSATISKSSRRVVKGILNNTQITILISDEILKEYQVVIRREKFRKQVTLAQVDRFIKIVVPKLEPIIIRSAVERSRDANDNFLLSMSVDGHADYLVTGDVDLLVLEKIEHTKIMRLNAFLNELRMLL